MKGKCKIALLYILSVILSVAPIAIFFFINLERYTKTVPETVKLCSGAGILLCIVVLKAIGKLHIPSAIYLYSIVFVLSYLLDAILQDLMIFALLALTGEILSLIVDVVIKRIRINLEREKTASMTAKEVEKVIAKQAGGRV